MVHLADGSTVTAVFNLPAVLVTIAVTILLVIGIQESANVNSVIVIIKVFVVLAVIVAGARFINPANWHPFIPENQGSFGDYGWSGIFRGAAVIFFAYIGFDAVSTAAQEAKNPQRDMPIGILGSLIICTVLYVLVSGVMVGLVPYKQLGVAAPMAVAIDAASVAAAGTPWEGFLKLMPMLLNWALCRIKFCDGRDDVGAATDFFYGQRWAAPCMGEEGSSEVSDPLHNHDRDRICGRYCIRIYSH
jgi:amino acid transporter